MFKFKSKNLNLLEGNISISLLKLSIPIILTSLMWIVYSLSDVKFISYFLGDESVNSAAAANFFWGLCGSIMMIPRIGTQILVAQMIGAKNEKLVKRYARAGIQVSFVLGLICMVVGFFFAEKLIRLIGINDVKYLYSAVQFLKYSTPGFMFLFVSSTIGAIISADGDTVGPFIINTISILLNIVLDYLFLGVFNYGIEGAAFATSFSILVAVILMYMYLIKLPKFSNIQILKIRKFMIHRNILKMGLPSGISQILMSLIAIQIATVISGINENVLGVQRLGIQFEALSWNISAGVASALSTFVAQNYGAKQYDRMIYSIKVSTIFMFVFGIFITLFFILYGKELYSAFLESRELINYGVSYITIIGLSQSFQCVDILMSASFNGMGQVKIPMYINVISKFTRIPLVYIFAPIYGLNGIWWVISSNTMIQCIIITISFIIYYKIFKRKEINL